ncbi:MAG: hypothetical protein ACK500_11025 [Flavobacteriales bacterium]
MEKNQIKLLIELAHRIETEEKDRDAIVASLQSAGILTKAENFTNHYRNLNRVFVKVKRS